jgi:hypothetical protein
MRPAIRAGIGEGVVHASKMAVSKITVMFKSKVTELVDQLQAKFPALMVIPCMAINTMSGTDLLETYARTVSEPYHDRIVAMDETFFLTVSEDDIRKVSCDADLSMLSMVRSLWKDLDCDDKAVVWNYFTVFERLTSAWRAHE